MNNIKGLVTTVKEVWYVLRISQRRQSMILLALMFIASALEVLGVGAIVPFMTAIVNPASLQANKWVVKILEIMNRNASSTMSIILIMGMGMVTVYIIKNAFIIFVHYIQHTFITSWQKDISIRMLRSYMQHPYEYFLQANSADILRSCSDDTNALFIVIHKTLVLILESTTVILIAVYMLYVDLFTAIGVLIIMTTIMLGIVLLFRPILKKNGIKNKNALSARNKSVTQIVQGIKEIMVMGRTEIFVDGFSKAAEDYRKSYRSYMVLTTCPDRITEGLGAAGIITVLCMRLLFISDDIALYVPKMAAFAMASFKILPSVAKISSAINNIIFNRPMQHNIYTNLEESEKLLPSLEKKYNNGSSVEIMEQSPEKEAWKNGMSDFTVNLVNVYWRYEKTSKDVLRGASMCINKGESIGIIGASGSGKTTTADILLGLLKPQKGQVTINGYDINKMPRTWANLVGYVPQSVFLLDDTVRTNISFGKTEVNDDDVWEALGRAQLAEFVQELPYGLDTAVGERGIRFSGGQRQRVAIARALMNKPQILIMDEATAALDNETEEAVMESIEALQGQVTLIIIAHRLTTIKNCDRIYEIVDGYAIERKKEEILH